jgi:hypothetical protein
LPKTWASNEATRFFVLTEVASTRARHDRVRSPHLVLEFNDENLVFFVFRHLDFMLGAGSPNHFTSSTLKCFTATDLGAFDVCVPQIDDQAIVPVSRWHGSSPGALNSSYPHSIVLELNTGFRCHVVTFNLFPTTAERCQFTS